jgi:5'-nucleotidase
MDNPEDIALFDMDSTLCDYTTSFKEYYNKIKSPNDPEFEDYSDMPEYLENRKKLIVNQPGWWENLKPLKLGFDILEVARELGFSIYILTKAPKNVPRAWTEKAKWAKKHVPDANIMMVHDKGLVYGKVLIDDYPPYIERWVKNRPRGLVIVPAQKWNKNFSHKRALRYDGTNLDKVRECLKAAKTRKPREELKIVN